MVEKEISIATEKTDVLWVVMPFNFIGTPCLTFALFKAILTQYGIKSRVQHEYLYFAQRMGLNKYKEIIDVATIGYGHDYFANETIFAEAAHGQTLRSFEEYLEWMTNIHVPHKVFAGKQQQKIMATLATFREAHDMAADYIKEAAERVMRSGARVVAFVSMYQQHNATIALAKRLKKEQEPPIIMVGGANCEQDAGAALAEYVEAFDYVFTGEADEIIAPMCQKLLKEGHIPDEELPAGVVTHTKKNAELARITADIDALPVPDFSDYRRELAKLLPEFDMRLTMTLEGSRGCWHAAHRPCNFCGLNGSRAHAYRQKSIPRLVEEMTELAKIYPHENFYFVENVLSYKHQKELPAALLQNEAYQKNSLQLFSEIKSPVSEADVQKLSQAGFYGLQTGIESFSDGVLRLMNKGVSAIKQIETMKHFAAHKLFLLYYLLVGTPGETPEQMEETNAIIPSIMHLQYPTTVAHVMYLRYSHYMEQGGPGVPPLCPDRGYDFIYPDREFIGRTAYLYSPCDETELAYYYDYRLLGEPYQKLYELTEEWRSSSQLLRFKDKGEVVKILDTRRIARQTLYQLTGAEADLCRACRSVRGEKGLLADMAAGYEAQRVKESLNYLLEAQIILKIGREYLTLAVDVSTAKGSQV